MVLLLIFTSTNLDIATAVDPVVKTLRSEDVFTFNGASNCINFVSALTWANLAGSVQYLPGATLMCKMVLM